MQLNIVKLVPVLVALSIVGQCLACSMPKQNKTSRVKREGIDIGGAAMQVAAIIVDTAQEGFAVKGDWKMKAGDYEIGNKYKMGTGRAMNDPDPSAARRKRSTHVITTPKNENALEYGVKADYTLEKRSIHPKFVRQENIESQTSAFIRSKRQAGGQPSSGGTSGISNLSLDTLRDAYNRIMEGVKQVVAVVRQTMGMGQPKPASSNAETLQ